MLLIGVRVATRCTARPSCSYDDNVRCSFRSTCVKALKRVEQNSARLSHAAVQSHRHAGRIDKRKRLHRLMIRYFVFLLLIFILFGEDNGLVTNSSTTVPPGPAYV